MQFVKASELKIGTSKLGKPFYNKDGVLLYGAGVKIDQNVIDNINALNMYGVYVLDMAEPIPPISEEELDFERFQTVQAYVVEELLDNAIHEKKPKNPKLLEDFTNLIYKNYCFRHSPITFNQSVRSERDFIYKHSLNVVILTALLANQMDVKLEYRKYLLQAALFHDIGKVLVPPALLNKTGPLTAMEKDHLNGILLTGLQKISSNYDYPSGLRHYIIQLSKNLEKRLPGRAVQEQVLLPGTKVIEVADIYDTLTAIRPYKDPISPFSALKLIRESPQRYDEKTVDALHKCIHILPSGTYVMLTNGEHGIVVRENEENLFRPIVLGFKSNALYDLSVRKVYEQIQVKDTVFTPDNRLDINKELIAKFVANQQKR